MAKVACDHSQAAFQSVASNGTQPVVTIVAKNADGSAVKDPLK